MNHLIELHPRLIVRRDNQRPVWTLRILAGDGSITFLRIGDLVNAALPVKSLHGAANVTVRELSDHVLERRVSLSDDLGQMRDGDAGVLQLLIRSAGVDRLVLAGVAERRAMEVSWEKKKRLRLVAGG